MFGDPFFLLRGQFQRQGGDDFADDLVLDGEHVAQFAIVSLGPDMLAVRRVDQLDGDAHRIAGLAHAALDHVTRAQFPPYLAHVGAEPLVGKGGMARDDR